MQPEPHVLLMRVAIQAVDPVGIEVRGRALDAMNPLLIFQQELREVGSSWTVMPLTRAIRVTSNSLMHIDQTSRQGRGESRNHSKSLAAGSAGDHGRDEF